MAKNIEIKAIIDDIENLYRKIKKISTEGPELLIQKDIFYKFPLGRLKLRQINDSSSEVIYYIRPNIGGPKTSKYYRLKLSNPKKIEKILKFLLGIKGVVEKRREVFFIGQTRVHIDSVDSLGEFIELEVVLQANDSVSYGLDVAKKLIAYLDIKKNLLIEKSYLEMLRT